MIRYLIPFAFVGSAMAHKIETRVNTTFHKIVHVTLHAKAAGTDKPPVLIYDATLPHTRQNKGIARDIEAWYLTPEILHTEGPIQIMYYDYTTKRPVECGAGIYQEKGSEKLMRINVDLNYSPDGVACTASGDYGEMTTEELTEDRSHVANIQELTWDD